MTSLVLCPSCEFTSFPSPYVQILQWESDELARTWSHVTAKLRHTPLDTRRGRSVLFSPGSDEGVWEAFCLQLLISDHVFFPEYWKLAFHNLELAPKEAQDLIVATAEEGLVTLIDDPVSLDHVGYGLRRKLDRSTRDRISWIRESPAYLDLTHVLQSSDGGLGWFALDAVTSFQSEYLLRNGSSSQSRIFEAHNRAFGDSPFPDLGFLLARATRGQLLAHLLGADWAVHDTQLQPLLLSWASPRALAPSEVGFVLGGSPMIVPTGPGFVHRLLRLRETVEFVRLRETLAARDLGDKEWVARIDEARQRANRIGDVVGVSISAILATAGSLLGGVPGALLAGVGGLVVGRAVGKSVAVVGLEKEKYWTVVLTNDRP